MTQFFEIHPDNPQARLIRQACEIMRQGGIVAYPTDSAYALGCQLGDKGAVDRIRRIRRLDQKHNFTLMCRDLSEISTYARVDNSAYRLLRTLTPGPYTFILKATHEVPRRLMHPKRKTIGIRVPDHAIAAALPAEMGEPILSTTLILPDQEFPMHDPGEILDALGGQVELVIDGGPCGLDATTVVDLSEGAAVLVRAGKGDTALFES